MQGPYYYPLTIPQESIWDIERFHRNSGYANVSMTVIIRERVKLDYLEAAVNFILHQHEGLRLRIREDKEKPYQYISSSCQKVFDRLDFSSPGDGQGFLAWQKNQTEMPMNTLESDLYYFALLKLEDSKAALYIKFHHLIADAWTMTMIIRDILNTYKNLMNGLPFSHDPRPSYTNYILEDIAYRNSQKYEENRAFWQELYKTVPEFTHLKDRVQRSDLTAKRKTVMLPASLSQSIAGFSDKYKISGFIIFLASLSLYIAKTTSKLDLVIGTPVLNRTNHQQKSMAGMFICNLPFRIMLNPEWNFSEFVNEISRTWKVILKNQKFPYQEILKDYRKTHRCTGALTDVFLSYQNAKFDVEDVDFESIWNFNGQEINSLSLHVSNWKDNNTLRLDYDYLAEALTDAEVDKIHHYLVTLLTQAVADPSKPLAEISLLTGREKQAFIHNNTNFAYPQEKTIEQLFAEQAVKTPDRTAIIANDKKLTYQQLNKRANQLADLLRKKGVGPGSIVGIMLKRSPELIIGILAVLKAGGAYLPIDPQYPLARIEGVLSDSKTKMLLTNLSLQEEKVLIERLAKTLGLETIDLNEASLYTGSSANLQSTAKPADLAYVIYTSGSTGAPKGVMIEHRSVNNLIHALQGLFHFPEQRTMVSLTTVAFDIFVMETLVPLAYGLCVVIADETEQKMPALLFKLIRKHEITMLQSTPSKIQSLIRDPESQAGLTCLKDIFIGGEPLTEAVLEKLRQTTPSARIFNMYGPTETTVWSMVKEVTGEDRITIGRPLANTQVYILDKAKEPVPEGVTGEIFIGGDGVARGYLGRPELTRERFLPNPFGQGKLYKTGDLGRWTAEGEIECLGRNDDQVKVRGFRIELGEIEKCLLNHEALQEAVVAVYEDSRQKNYLCAYLVGEQRCSTLEIRTFLEQRLPDYMIPAKFIWLDALPLTPNCKVDKKALPDPSIAGGLQDAVRLPPRNEIDAELAALWAKALDVEKIGIDDNFFLLGGDSLAIIEVLTGIWVRKWDLTAQDFYDYPTIRQLSDKLRGLVRRQANTEQTGDYPHPEPCFAQLAENALPPCQGNVLLTGATGFLGIHLLWELLNNTPGSIYCLVRGGNAEERLRNLFKHYFSAAAESKSERIIIVNGDISKKQFGLTPEEYHELGQNVFCVINAAGLVKHYGDYQDFWEVNVQGTREVIQFCLAFGRPLNHISTVSIAGNQLAGVRESRCFSETELFIGQNYRDNLYIRSKFEAEVCVLNGRDSGLKAAIFRVGILTGRYSDGRFQGNIAENAFYQKLKSLLSIRAIPQERLSQDLEFTPVDFCARGIVKIMRTNIWAGRVFHMLNHKTIKTDKFRQILAALGIEIEAVDLKTFYQLVEDAMHLSQSDSLRGLVLDLSEETPNQPAGKIEILSDITQAYLRQTGFEWPEVNADYLKKLLEHMIRVGFLQQII